MFLIFGSIIKLCNILAQFHLNDQAYIDTDTNQQISEISIKQDNKHNAEKRIHIILIRHETIGLKHLNTIGKADKTCS